MARTTTAEAFGVVLMPADGFVTGVWVNGHRGEAVRWDGVWCQVCASTATHPILRSVSSRGIEKGDYRYVNVTKQGGGVLLSACA